MGAARMCHVMCELSYLFTWRRVPPPNAHPQAPHPQARHPTHAQHTRSTSLLRARQASAPDAPSHPQMNSPPARSSPSPCSRAAPQSVAPHSPQMYSLGSRSRVSAEAPAAPCSKLGATFLDGRHNGLKKGLLVAMATGRADTATNTRAISTSTSVPERKAGVRRVTICED